MRFINLLKKGYTTQNKGEISENVYILTQMTYYFINYCDIYTYC
jgi:hypothetical protein